MLYYWSEENCDRHTWCQLSEELTLWQGRTFLSVVTMASKPTREHIRISSLEEVGHTHNFLKASQLAPIFLQQLAIALKY